MKTFDKKDVYSWSNAEEAKQYIGACGYFADSLADLQECVSNNNIMRLFNICLEPKIDVDSVFSLTETDYQYALFLPVDKVKEVEESISFSINCTNSQLESYLEALNFVIGLATMICPKDELHLVSLAEELENILNKGLAK